jgi:hypothetical protein
MDFIDGRDGWSQPKRMKNASLVDENDFVSTLFDNDAQLYAQRCLEQVDYELICDGYTSGSDVEIVLLFLLPVLGHIQKMTNQAIRLHNLDAAVLELFELVQFTAILMHSHFSNFSFESVIDDMNARNLITPTLERLRWIQHNFKLYSPSKRGEVIGANSWTPERERDCGIKLVVLGSFGAKNKGEERCITSHSCCQACCAVYVQQVKARSRWSYTVCSILPLTSFQAQVGTERWHQGTEARIYCLFHCFSPAKEE